MTIAEYCILMRVEVSDDVVLAASVLQAKGYRFLVHFGTDNAVSCADIALRGKMRQ